MNRSRRRFLKGAGTAGIAALGGVSLLSKPTAAASPGDIPTNYLAEYRETGEQWGLDWTYLAGIGWVESHHGQYEEGCEVSSAGARGPMQFIPSTWDAYGLDANNDGVADICDYQDAIPSAANYLTASGAPENWDEALYAYNHSWEYVNEVKNTAAYYRDVYGNGDGGGGDGGGGGSGFSDGDQVKSTVNLNTRYRPGTESRVLDTQPAGTTGEIMNGPVSEDGYTWWGVHWSDGVWGWSAGQYLAETGTSGGGGEGFGDGERVTPTTNLNTRSRPGTESRVLDTMSPSTVGEIMNGPVNEDGYTWWGIHWLDANIWGWSAGQYLESSSGGGGGGGDGETDLVWPMSGYITSPYGPRSSGFHGGVDIGHYREIGTPIYAAHDGTAYTAYDPGGYGNFVYIVHTNGYMTEYGHVNSFAISDGQTVAQGDHIAGMGASGNATGPHVHFGIEQNNNTKPIPGSDGQTVTAGEGIPKDYTGL